MIADCDQRLARHRAALEAGTDPSLIASWSAEVSLTRAAAKARLREPGARPARLTPEEIKAIVEALGSILTVIRDADPLDKAQIYASIGLRLTYQPGTNTEVAEARRPATVYEGLCPRGDIDASPTDRRHDPDALLGHCADALAQLSATWGTNTSARAPSSPVTTPSASSTRSTRRGPR
jgi:hypothetical protein